MIGGMTSAGHARYSRTAALVVGQPTEVAGDGGHPVRAAFKTVNTGIVRVTEPVSLDPADATPAATGATPQWQYVLGVIVVAVLLVVAWQQFLGGGVVEPAGSPSPTPVGADASVAPTASAGPTATATPGPSQSAKPSETPKATATTSPTSGPTTAPTSAPTSAPTTIPTAFCAMPGTGLNVAYPADWYTLDQPPFQCVPYDDAPITVSSDRSTPDAPVAAVAEDIAYSDALSELTDPASWQVQSQKDTTVSGLPAVVVEESWIGKAPYVVGTMRYFYLVNNGDFGSILFITQGLAGAAFDDQTNVVDLMAAQSTIK